MRARGVVGTPGKSAVIKVLIKPQVLGSDAAHDLGAKVLIKARSVDSVEVPKHRTVRLKSCIQVAAGAPRHFALNAEVAFDQRVAAEIKIGAATQALGEIGEACGGVRRSTGERAEAKCCIYLLSLNITCHRKESAYSHCQHQLFHISSGTSKQFGCPGNVQGCQP